jgi:hypothetical protein
MKMMKEKRGWIRIIEAVAAILIIISAVLVFVSSVSDKPDVAETIANLEKAILNDISLNGDMRSLVVNYNQSDPLLSGTVYLAPLLDFVKNRMPAGLRYNVNICISEPAETCRPNDYSQIADKQLFVDDRIIFEGGITKKAVIFIWLK